MICIHCSKNTKVTNSRHQKRVNRTWRRRQCVSCSSVFTTLEAIEGSSALAVLSGSSLEPFSRDKLLLDLYESLKHRKSPIRDATGLTDTIIGKLTPYIKDASIARNDIIEVTAEVLGRFDEAASVHFNAFHKRS